MIIDDDDDLREVLGMELESFGYEVQDAADGEAGLALAAAWRPAIVLCDLGLPVMNGCEVARRLRNLGIEALRLVALTGFDSEEDRQRTRDAGFDAHVVKGTAGFFEELEKAVPRVVRARSTGR